MIFKIIYILMILLNVFFFIVGIKKKFPLKWFNLVAIIILVIMYFLIDWKNL
jgi:hypothetical protein